MNTATKTWLITGTSSGLGRAFAEAVLAYGYNAVITSRNPDDIQDIVDQYPDSALGLSLDITDKTQITDVVKQAEAKFALEGMSDALRKELLPLGIKVVVIEPGAFRTDFAGRSLKGAKKEIADYNETVGPRRKENGKSSGTQPGDPKKAAQVIIRMEKSEQVPFRLLLGSDALQIISKELDAQKKELEDWKDISLTTDF